MKFKVAIDNNFFQNYQIFNDDKIKHRIKESFINRTISFYPTLELICEFFGLCKTNAKDFLKEYANFLYETTALVRFLKPWNEIIQREIGIVDSEHIFLDQSSIRKLRQEIENLSKGNQPDFINEILEWVKSIKERNYLNDVACRNKMLELRNPQELIKIGFKDVETIRAITDWKKNITSGIFRKAGKVISKRQLYEISNNHKRYPYFHNYLKLEIVYYYRNDFLQRKIDPSASFDIFQLVYLTQLDYFISNEKVLKEVADMVFEKKGKVINFTQFVGLITEWTLH